LQLPFSNLSNFDLREFRGHIAKLLELSGVLFSSRLS
jgi:hypothetical protein